MKGEDASSFHKALGMGRPLLASGAEAISDRSGGRTPRQARCRRRIRRGRRAASLVRGHGLPLRMRRDSAHEPATWNCPLLVITRTPGWDGVPLPLRLEEDRVQEPFLSAPGEGGLDQLTGSPRCRLSRRGGGASSPTPSGDDGRLSALGRSPRGRVGSHIRPGDKLRRSVPKRRRWNDAPLNAGVARAVQAHPTSVEVQPGRAAPEFRLVQRLPPDHLG